MICRTAPCGAAISYGKPGTAVHRIASWALHQQGWQIAIHGNGDEAIQLILDAYEEAQKRYPRADARHIIIHCQTVREDQLDRIKRLGVVPSFFVVHTYFWGDRHRDIFLGPDRAKRISPLRSALKRGILFSNHNDTFVTPIDPLLSVWSAVNRRHQQRASPWRGIYHFRHGRAAQRDLVGRLSGM